MRINEKKFQESLNYLKNYEENKSIYLQEGIEKAKEELIKFIRDFELPLRESNSNFTEYCLGNINYESIFDQIDEVSSEEAIEDEKEGTLEIIFSHAYFTSLLEVAESPESKEETDKLISILEIFRKGEISRLETMYQNNKEKIDDAVEVLRAIALSFDETPIEVISCSSSSLKGKSKVVQDKWESYTRKELEQELENRGEVIEMQKKSLEQKNEKVRLLEEEINKLKLENKIEIPPKN
jgi:hypothetical protein